MNKEIQEKERARMDNLRRRAEEKVLHIQPEALKKLSSEDIHSLVQELGVHQIELEIQNEELRRAHEQIEASRRRYIDLYDFAPVGYFTFDEEGSILEVNLTGAKQVGQNRKDLLNRPFGLLVARGDRDIFFQHHRRVVQTRTRQSCDLRLMRPDGTEFYARLESIPVEDNQGKGEDNTCCCRTAVTDITRAKQAEEELELYRRHLEELVQERTAELNRAMNSLQESEAKYSVLVEQAQDGVMIIQDGVIKFANRAMAGMSGYTLDEITGKPLLEIAAPESRELIWQRYSLRLSGRDAPAFYETQLQQRDGTQRQVEISAGLIDYQGRPASMAIVRDITERKKMEEEMQKMQKLESIGVLAGGIAHDFRNLLMSIVGSISLAKLHLSRENKAYQLLLQAEAASFRATDLSSQLLTFARGGAPVKKISSVADILKSTADFALKGAKTGCEFLLPDDLWQAEVDPGQISQAVGNLVINADQAMPEGGLIKLSAENVTLSGQEGLPLEAGSYIKVSIRDQGVGIPEKHLPKIFDPYFTTKEQGSGLGSSIVYSIIKRHGGYITVESQLGVGTAFTFYLPAIPQKIKAEKEVEQELSFGRGRVLFMEDDEMVRNTGRQMLEYLGYEVETARCGTEAVELFQKAKESGRSFCAVILDLIIPGGMGGKKTFEKIRRIDPETKVIVASGYSNDPVMTNYKAEGFQGVLPKPFTVEELAQTLSHICG